MPGLRAISSGTSISHSFVPHSGHAEMWILMIALTALIVLRGSQSQAGFARRREP
jgi:hypothetical protein